MDFNTFIFQGKKRREDRRKVGKEEMRRVHVKEMKMCLVGFHGENIDKRYFILIL